MAGTLTISTLSDGTNSTSATNPIRGSAKAWVNFNGVTSTVRKSYNVSSVTLNTTGTYTISYTNALPDADYCAVGTTINTNSMALQVEGSYNGTPTTYSTTQTRFSTSQSSTLYTCSVVNVVVFD